MKVPPIYFISCAGFARRSCSIGSIQSPLSGRVAVPVEWCIMGRNHDALDVEMIVETLRAAFAPDAGIANAAPGRGRIEPVMIVDPDDSALDRGGHAMGARH